MSIIDSQEPAYLEEHEIDVLAKRIAEPKANDGTFQYSSEINLQEMVNEQARKVQRRVDEATLDKVADTLADFGYVKVNGNSRWLELFGTPERTAKTLREFELDYLNWCHGTDGCESCPYEFDRYGCYLPDDFELLKWLRGDA